VRMLHLTGPDLGPTGGWVELNGPLRITRRLRTTVVERVQPSRIAGIAELGPRTRARVIWSLQPRKPGCTHVRLEARLEAASFPHRLLLAIGARGWLAARFRQTLAQLALLLAAERDPDRPEVVDQTLGAGVVEGPLAL
jgi:hypothetical protein